MDCFKSLKKIELFRHLPDDDLRKVSSLCHEKHYAKNERIMEEGEAGDEVFFIPKWLVGIDFRISEGNYIQRVYHVMKGEVFGELALFGHKRTARVTALEDIDLLFVSSQELKHLMRGQPRIGYMMLSNLCTILADRLMISNLTLREMMSKQSGFQFPA